MHPESLPQSETQPDNSQPSKATVPVFPQVVILVLVLFILLGANFTQHLWADSLPILATPVSKSTEQPASKTLIIESNTLDVTVEATAAFVWDVRNQQVLYQKNADQQLPLASITKLMTALLAHELLSEGIVTISRAAINQEGPSSLNEAERFTAVDISDLMLLSSSNDGAYALAETLGRQFDSVAPAEAFVALMNIRARELGLTQTVFRNPTGLDISETATGGVGSARDVAFLMTYLLEHAPEVLAATANPTHTIVSQDGIAHTVQNTNQNIAHMAGIIGSKTGYTTLAGGNLVLALDTAVNRPVVAVILHSSWEGRFTDMDEIIRALQDSLG